MTWVKWESGNILEGLTEKAYVFSLMNKENKPFKAACSNNGEYAIWYDSEFGPCFGGDDNLWRNFV